MKIQLISIITVFALLGLFLPLATSGQSALWLYFVVDKAGNIALDSANVWPEEYGGIWNESVATDSAYEVRILNSWGSIVSKAYFIPDFLILSDPPVEVDETVAEVVFPYSPSVRTVQVLKGGQQVLRQSIWSQLCNWDRVCNNNENHFSCPSDCGPYSQDGVCNSISNDGYCDPDCIWDTEPGGDCTKPNCNDGIKNQDETDIDKGGICQRLKCQNRIQDLGEWGIDCGGPCEQQCPRDPCGDGICAEYEDAKNCSIDCGSPVSVFKNSSTSALTGYLVMKIQKNSGYGWYDREIIIKEHSARTIAPGEQLDLRKIFNRQGAYIAKESGRFRVYAALLSSSGAALISGHREFSVQ